MLGICIVSMKQKLYFWILDAFLKLKLHVIFKPLASGFELWAHYAYFSAWISQHQPPIWDDKTKERNFAIRRFQLHQRLFDSEHLGEAIDYLEFGVSTGVSFKWWREHNQHPQSRFHGFDTFTGLPESWMGNDVGAFTNQGNLPSTDGDTRATFHQGLFQQTLPTFLDSYAVRNRRVLHLDPDIYSATLYVLTQLARFIQKDDILLFDEFSDVTGEFRAFKHFSESFYLQYQVLGAVNNYCQVAIKIL